MAKFRLPAALGGGEFVGEYVGYDKGQYRYEGHLEGLGTTHLALAHDLDEIKPPSIDDPVSLPLVLGETSDQYELKVWHGAGDLACVRIGKDGKVRELTPEERRDVARALWQLPRGGA